MSGQNVVPFPGTSAQPARKCNKKLLCDVIIFEFKIAVTLEPIKVFSLSWEFWTRIFAAVNAKYEWS
jgi:hypothetical protein